jgi:N-acetylglucosamine-6-phosphate deacetylase
MDRAVANTVAFTGLRLTDVAAMASTIPAHYMGMTPADTVVADWDPDRNALHVRSVTTAGADLH